MNNFDIGQYGYFEFTLRKEVFGHVFEPPFEMYGEIIAIGETNVQIKDCYGIKYSPEKSMIRTFSPLMKPDESDIKLTNIKTWQQQKNG